MINYYHEHEGKGMPTFDNRLLERLQAGKDYIIAPALERAVNLALYLGQPLLLTGEPGTGKTELARHLAQRFSPQGLLEDYYVFNTKTTSSARDLFYRYDSLRHFQFAQHHDEELDIKTVEERFVTYQALGEAIRSGRRAVVLIDEVDKAPRDFPNDILDVLEQLSFEVPELGYTGKKRIKTTPENRPMLILTSNSEKNLPDAFLRRCVFYHIPFPDHDLLLKILSKKSDRFQKATLESLIEHFQKIRTSCRRKKPSTAELLQWIAVLEKMVEAKTIREAALSDEATAEEKEILLTTYSVLVKDREDLIAVEPIMNNWA